MPIYEYSCPNCQNVFETWRKISENTEEAPCPHCAGQARRIISNTAFVLKGGGWYVTDYGYRKGAKEDGQSTAGSAGSSTAASSASSAPAAGDAGPGSSPAPVAPATPASQAASGV